MNLNLDIGLLKHQLRFVHSNKRFVAMVCGRGAGKSYVASYVAVLKAIQGERVILFAQSWDSLIQCLLRECKNRVAEIESFISEKTHSRFKINCRCSREIIEFPGGGVIYGATYPSQERVRGFTQISTLILDEAAMSKPDILQIAQPCMRALPDGQEPKTYAITTPKAGSWFNKFVLEKLEKHPEQIDLIQAKSTDNFKIKQSEYDNYASNFTNESFIRQELMGEILNLQAENSILAGIVFKKDYKSKMPDSGQVVIGIDGSGYGKDNTVITYRVGLDYEQFSYDKLTGIECRNEVKKYLALNPKYSVKAINIDMAYGEKYFENLCLEYDNCNLVNFGSTPLNDKYFNKRAEMYFNLVDALNKGLPLTNEIEDELNVTLFEFSNNGKLKLVNKDEIKEVLRHSPDKSDSLALTFVSKLEVYNESEEIDTSETMQYQPWE